MYMLDWQFLIGSYNSHILHYLKISKPLSILSLSDTHHDIEDFTLSDLLPSSLDKFWRYDGSLTTPLCNEVVTWTLFEDTIEISKNQVNEIIIKIISAVEWIFILHLWYNAGNIHLFMDDIVKPSNDVSDSVVIF